MAEQAAALHTAVPDSHVQLTGLPRPIGPVTDADAKVAKEGYDACLQAKKESDRPDGPSAGSASSRGVAAHPSDPVLDTTSM